ncbi:MAG TPA: MarR family transcriptional regulator [Pseudonocardiaceae bacterium]|jgi:DNA-binding MarR family transcriptional regulator|nr:MarR family transcriptional regulator [Pseudonocardiaceae bacterium]
MAEQGFRAGTVADLSSDGDELDELELATAVLVRNLELLRRRGDLYADLDRAEYLLLRTLDQLGPADIGTLAYAVGLDPSTVGRQVSVMEDKALVLRTAAAHDRRRSIVAPSAEGRRRMELTRQRRRDATARLLGDWTATDKRRLGNLLTRYNKAVARDFLTT